MNINEFPTIDSDHPDFKEQLAFNLWSTHSCSDYRNDRERPYNGQPHTDDGIRGASEVKGVTFRDIKDCLIRAMLMSASTDKYFEDWPKLWDFSTGEQKPTQYLIDHQDDYVSAKVDLGTWRPQDVYKIDFNNVDMLAVAQNLTCEIEKMMGIFPNI